MAHGTPDWGLTAGTVTTYQLSDLAELAARLGSIITFDRRGEGVFLDDFNDGLRAWTTSGSGTGNTVDLSPSRARSGQFAARLVAGSTGSVYASIEADAPILTPSRLGLEVSFNIDTKVTQLLLRFLVYDGDYVTQFDARWVKSTQTLEVRDQDANWQIIASGIQLSTTDQLFHTLKYVGDASNARHVRLLLDHLAVDTSTISARHVSSAILGAIQIIIIAYGTAAVNAVTLLDNVILTQNEPP